MKSVELEMPGNHVLLSLLFPQIFFLHSVTSLYSNIKHKSSCDNVELLEVEYNELIPWRAPESTLYFTLDGKVVWADRGLSDFTVKANPKGIFPHLIPFLFLASSNIYLCPFAECRLLHLSKRTQTNYRRYSGR